MAWSTPRTWVAGELVTAAMMNAHVRDNLNFLYTAQGARAYRSGAAQSVNSGVATKVQLNAESFDPNGWFDATTNYRFQPTVAGKYLCVGRVSYHDLNNARFRAVLYKNGAAVAGDAAGLVSGTTNDVAIDTSDVIDLNGSTDYVELYAHHEHGSARDVDPGTSKTFLNAVRIGA